MKRIRLVFAITAAAVVIGSCSKEEKVIDEVKPESKVFTCTIQNDDATKTTLDTGDGNKVKWEAKDEICINGVQHSLSDGSGTASGTFTPKGGESSPGNVGGFYYAFYADLTNTGDWYETNCSFVLPNSYTYNGGKLRMPMYAKGNDLSLSFKNICGVLRLKLNRDCGLSQVSTITVSSTAQLYGEFTADKYGNMTFVDGTSKSKGNEISIACGNKALSPNTQTSFYIPITPTEHQLTITVSDGTTDAVLSMTSASSFSRSTLYTMDDNSNFKTDRGADPSTAI